MRKLLLNIILGATALSAIVAPLALAQSPSPSPSPFPSPTPFPSPSPSPSPCSTPGSINAGFNGTAITGTASGPAYIWFNSNFNLKNVSAGAMVTLTGSHVVINGSSYDVPNAKITFANVACATTSYDAGTNTWNTTVPVGGSDEIFLSGVAVPVNNLPGGASVTWDGTFATTQPGVCIQWKWGAAAYTNWTLAGGSPDYNAAMIKPTHNDACGISNGDHAGTRRTASSAAP